MWAITEAIVPPVVGNQVHIIPALSWVLGLSILTSVCVPLTALGMVVLLLQSVVPGGFVPC